MAPRPVMVRLAPGEVEILTLMMNGATTKQAAKELVISYEAAKTRLARSMRKLGAVSTVQAVALGLVTGQLDGRLVVVTSGARASARDALRAAAHSR